MSLIIQTVTLSLIEKHVAARRILQKSQSCEVKRRQDKQTHDKTRTDLQQAESYRILTVLRWAEQSQAALEYKGENAFRISAHFISKGERQQKCQTLKGKTYCDLLDAKAGGGRGKRRRGRF